MTKQLFLKRFKHLIKINDNLTIDFILLCLQIEKQFEWEMIENNYFIFKRTWIKDDLEIKQQLCIQELMNKIKEIQDLSKDLNKYAIKIKILKNETLNGIECYSKMKKNKLETMNNIFNNILKDLNSKMKDFSQICMQYDMNSLKINRSSNKMLWTTKKKNSLRESILQINEFDINQEDSENNNETQTTNKSDKTKIF